LIDFFNNKTTKSNIMKSLNSLKEKEIDFENQKCILGGGETLQSIEMATSADPPYHCGDWRHGMKYDNGRELYCYYTYKDCRPAADTVG
jgi:hypothetical protein